MVNLNRSRSILSPNKIDRLSSVRISQRARENNTLLLSFFEDHVSQPRSQQIIARIAPVMPELHIDIIRPCLTELISAVTSFRSTPLHRKRLQQRNGRSHINIVLTRAIHRQRSCWDHIRQRRTATGNRQPDQGSDGNQEGTGTHQATMQRQTPKSYAVQRICTLINKTHEDDCREIPTSDQVCYTSTEPNQPATCVIEHAIVPIRAVEPVDRHTN